MKQIRKKEMIGTSFCLLIAATVAHVSDRLLGGDIETCLIKDYD